MHGEQKQTTWGSKPRQYLVWAVGITAVGIAIWTVRLSLRSLYWYPWVYAFWVIAPPIWFFIEFYFIFDRRNEPEIVALLKAGQDVAQKFWAALLVLLAGIGYFQWHLGSH